MGKNKQKGKKVQNQTVFQVANRQFKPKTKTKPVKTSLKHINLLKNEKVEKLNKIFTEVQKDVKSISKPKSEEPKKEKMTREAPREPVNVDGAAQLFSQL